LDNENKLITAEHFLIHYEKNITVMDRGIGKFVHITIITLDKQRPTATFSTLIMDLASVISRGPSKCTYLFPKSFISTEIMQKTKERQQIVKYFKIISQLLPNLLKHFGLLSKLNSRRF